MRRLPLAVLTGLALALPGPASADWRRSRPAPEPTPPNLPATERGSVEPTPTALPATPAADLPPIYFPEPHYRLLREAEAQCLAVRFAWLANLLDKEREQMAKAHPPPSGCQGCFGAKADRGWELRRRILYYAALDDRNRSAGQALPLYFKAAELETQIALLQTTRDDLAGAIKKSEELSKKGFRLPTDPGALRRQLLDTEADLIRAQAGLLDVNGRLKGLIGFNSDVSPTRQRGSCPKTLAGASGSEDDFGSADDWLWPAVEVQVTFEGVEVEGAVKLALEKRPELLLLREMSGDLDKQTLPVVREYLHGVSGLMGASGGPTKRLAETLVAVKALLSGGTGEKESRQAQIAQLLAERERAVAEEVRRGVADLHAKARLVALSRERVLSADEHRRDAEQKAARAGGSFLEVLSANLDWYKARNQLTVDVMAWHTARARVREAQGVFVWECCVCKTEE
jgi:hypothetical protein